MEDSAPRHLSGDQKRSGKSWPWVVACVLWVAYIWGHSLVPGPSSLDESGFVVNLLSGFFGGLGIEDPDLRMFIIRKSAHFLEYAVLGILMLRLRRSMRPSLQPRLLSAGIAALCALVPVVDESIQRFVPGRTGQLRDVFLDLAGACTGALIASAIRRHRQKRPR